MLGHRLLELPITPTLRPKGLACVRQGRFAARRNCYLPLNRFETNIDATGIPQYEQEWMAREEHV